MADPRLSEMLLRDHLSPAKNRYLHGCRRFSYAVTFLPRRIGSSTESASRREELLTLVPVTISLRHDLSARISYPTDSSSCRPVAQSRRDVRGMGFHQIKSATRHVSGCLTCAGDKSVSTQRRASSYAEGRTPPISKMASSDVPPTVGL